MELTVAYNRESFSFLRGEKCASSSVTMEPASELIPVHHRD